MYLDNDKYELFFFNNWNCSEITNQKIAIHLIKEEERKKKNFEKEWKRYTRKKECLIKILVLDQQFIILERKMNTISQNYVHHANEILVYLSEYSPSRHVCTGNGEITRSEKFSWKCGNLYDWSSWWNPYKKGTKCSVSSFH